MPENNISVTNVVAITFFDKSFVIISILNFQFSFFFGFELVE